MAITVRELALKLGIPAEGDESREISGAGPVEAATIADLSFAGNRKVFDQASASSAGCLIVPRDYSNVGHQTLLRSPNPRGSFAAALKLLFPDRPLRPGIHPTTVIHPTANVHASCEVGPCVTVGEGTVIDERSRIGSGCTIGGGVRIGSGAVIHSGVRIYDGVTIGANVILHSGCVLGADGFGFVLQGDRYEKFPQVGIVRIGDDVEIGANSCVDRAALGVTEIGTGAKLDNLVHIAHNCRIGRHVVIAAQTGLSGGVVVEDYAVIGGQVGIGDKARIESRAVLGSGSGILTSKVVRSGAVVWGTPARPLKEHLASLAHLRRLPELREEVNALRRRLDELQGGK